MAALPLTVVPDTARPTGWDAGDSVHVRTLSQIDAANQSQAHRGSSVTAGGLGLLGQSSGEVLSRGALGQRRVDQIGLGWWCHATDRLRPIEVKAYARISTQQKSNAITPPAPQFEHPRVQKFVREVFEAVGYGKMSADEAAKQLNEQGATILNRL